MLLPLGVSKTKQVDILFINLSNLPGRPVYPYAFVQVSALARKSGLSVVRWDGLDLSREDKLDCISQLIQKHQPRAIAFTVRQADSVAADNYISLNEETPAKNPWFPLEDTRAAIKRVRETTDAKVLVGGFNFTVNSINAAAYLQPDLGIMGEPDELFEHFEEVLQGRTEGISNLIYQKEGEWRQNERVYWGPLEEIEYTEEIIEEIFRFHGERALRNAHLEEVPGLGSYKDTGLSTAIEIARGCPCSCVFCCEPIVKGKRVRNRSLDVIEAEIKNLLAYGLRYYWFICSELNFSKKHVLALAERIINLNKTLKRPIFWRAYFLPGVFTKDEFRILLRSGLLIEQSGAFTTLSDENLKKMREPYRVKHALEHIKNIMELNDEPEFKDRKQPRWVLWSWLGNPYATLASIRTTLETFSKEKLDIKYDEADSYPALRVYACLENLPEEVKNEAIIVTQEEDTPKTTMQPSYFYNSKLVEHFSTIGEIHDFMQYVRDTFLSRAYRLNLNWRLFAQNLTVLELDTIIEALKDADLETIELPSWVEHPDLGKQNPLLWRQQACNLLNQGAWAVQQFIKKTVNQESENAILAFIFHAFFAIYHKQAQPIFQRLNLPIDSEGYPPESAFLTASTLLKRYSSESAVFESLGNEFSTQQITLLKYYFHALNISLKPTYSFLAAPDE
jgi:hypothetical protein